MPSQVATRAFLAVILLVLAPAVAFAQASITGVVRDGSGAVLPGVSVEAASPALIEKIRTVVTGLDGQYRIVDLRPGVYTVTFTLAGFSTVKREALELSGSLTATVDADMRVGGVEETITVTGATPLVDVQSVQQQWVLDKEIIDTLPTGRTTINVAVLIPGMTLSTTFSGEGQDVGGQHGRGAADAVHSRQSRRRHAADGRWPVDAVAGDIRQRVRGQQRHDSGSDGRHLGRLGGAVGWRRSDEHHPARGRQHLQRLALPGRVPARTSRATTSTRSSGRWAWSRPAPSRATGRSTRRSAGRCSAIGSGSSRRAAPPR